MLLRFDTPRVFIGCDGVGFNDWGFGLTLRVFGRGSVHRGASNCYSIRNATSGLRIGLFSYSAFFPFRCCTIYVEVKE